MKKYFAAIVMSTAFLSAALPAFAEVGNGNSMHGVVNTRMMISGEPTGMHPGMGAMKGKMEMNTLSGTPSGMQQWNLQSRADKELTRRLNSLQELLKKINDIKHLTADQKTLLTTQVQNEITNLMNLQTKIKADTDPVTLKADIQSIVQDYRVYALFMPQIRLLISADRLGDITDSLSIIITKLQTRISQVPPSTDLAAAQNALTDMQTKLSDAKTQEQNAISTVISLTPQGYPGNKTSLQNARTMLQNAKQDILVMLEDMQLVRTTLMKLENVTTVAPTQLTPMPSMSVTQPLSPSPTM